MYCGTFPYSIKSTRHGGLFFVTKTLQGTVHGRTIELDDDVGAPEGQEVRVHVTFLAPAGNWGEGILESAGGWADYPEMDAIMEEIYQSRKVERRPQMENP